MLYHHAIPLAGCGRSAIERVPPGRWLEAPTQGQFGGRRWTSSGVVHERNAS
jgi:hypothetical protein